VQVFNQFAVPGTIAAALLLGLSLWSLAYYTGPGRIFLDRWIPPWSIYKVIQGSTFLKNVAVQTRAGIQLFDTVNGMLSLATPWMRERLQAAMYGIEQGKNLGEALHNAGYEFPDRRSVQILRVLASRDGFDETLYNFAKRWAAGSVKRVERASGVLLVVAILIMGGVTGTALLGMQSLASMIEEAADATASHADR
jgi:type II secretory pathway component PulF